MRRTALAPVVALAVFAAAPLFAQTSAPATMPATPAATPAAMPAVAADFPAALTAINAPETVTIKSTDRDISGYLVSPRVDTPHPVIVLVHDIFGMTDFAKSMADNFARQGYTVLIPDLYSRFPGGDKPLDAQQAAKAYAASSDQQILSDLHAAIEYLNADSMPSAGQPLAVVGIDMGGTYAMMTAGTELRVSAAINFYGRIVYAENSAQRPVSPVERLFNVGVPLLCFYGTLDPQAPAGQIKMLENRLATNPNKTFYHVVQFPNVGHGFLDPSRAGYNAAAAKDAISQSLAFLKRNLQAPKKEE